MHPRKQSGWTSPPTRREISLLLFSVSVFLLGYNIESSLRLLGLDPVTTQGALIGRLGFGSSSVIGKDARRPPGWRDATENLIYGDWNWDEGQVAGNGAERSQTHGVDRHKAMWLGTAVTGPVSGGVFGNTSVNDAFTRWGADIPRAKVLKHVPGYTIIDNLIIFNYTTYLVVDDPASVPAINSIFSPTRPDFQTPWRIISAARARRLGTFGGKIHGVTFLSTDANTHNSTLMSLWRTYSSLDPSIDSEGHTVLPPPRRLIFTSIIAFSDPRPSYDTPIYPRVRSETGHHAYLPKAAFPTLMIGYQDDWEDYHSMAVPFVIERAVIADRAAAAGHVDQLQPVFLPAFDNIQVSKHWWEPVRRELSEYMGAYEEVGKEKKGKPVVTLIDNQDSTGLVIRPNDHQALVASLLEMGHDYGYEVNIVSAESWHERMLAVARSTIVLGVHGGHFHDSVYMKRSPQNTLMEFFPDGVYIRDQEVMANAIGTRYIAWWNDQKFSGDSLPAVTPPAFGIEVAVDAKAVVQAIREALSHT